MVFSSLRHESREQIFWLDLSLGTGMKLYLQLSWISNQLMEDCGTPQAPEPQEPSLQFSLHRCSVGSGSQKTPKVAVVMVEL